MDQNFVINNCPDRNTIKKIGQLMLSNFNIPNILENKFKCGWLNFFQCLLLVALVSIHLIPPGQIQQYPATRWDIKQVKPIPKVYIPGIGLFARILQEMCK